MHPNEEKAYTVWNMATLARKRNHGSRVDFLLAASLSSSEEVLLKNPELFQLALCRTQKCTPYTAGSVCVCTSAGKKCRCHSVVFTCESSGLRTQSSSEQPFEDCFTDVRIWSGFEGSDHAPVWADLQLPDPLPVGDRPPALDLANRRTGSGDQHC